MNNTMTFSLQPKLLFVSEVASMLRCSSYKVYELLHSGRLKGYQTTENGTWLIPVESVEALIRESMEQYEAMALKSNDQRTSK